jgi:hemolysin III
VRRCQGGRGRRLTLLIFGASLVICYAASTLFHAVRLSRSWLVWFDQLDHIGIFILIAGSYTPVAWTLLRGTLRSGTLLVVWSLSALGTVLLLTQGVFSMFWSTIFYLTMGWGALVCYIEISRVRTQRTIFPLLLGGILYSIGAIINLMEWPVFHPGFFGAHELFHLFVMGGSLAHFRFMFAVVAPAEADALPVARHTAVVERALVPSLVVPPMASRSRTEGTP